MRALGVSVTIVAVVTMLLTPPRPKAEPITVRPVSEIKGIAFKKLGVLPKAPTDATKGSDCDSFVIKPKSEAGKGVAGQGWYVTGEARLGPYQVVSFAGHFERETSGTCDISEGNVGIFDATRIIALAYVPRASQQSIGEIKPLEGGAVRIWSGDPLPVPVGDIELANDHLRLGPLAARESLCGGKAIVPNIYGLPIDQARKALDANGWKPVKQKPKPEEDTPLADRELLSRGIIELDSCSGTGLNFCGFNYEGPGGSLAVSTAGEWNSDRGEFPHVASYNVTCR